MNTISTIGIINTVLFVFPCLTNIVGTIGIVKTSHKMREIHRFASLGQAQCQISGRDRSERAAGPPPFTDALIFAHSQKLRMANRSSSCCGGSRKNREALRDMRPKLPKFENKFGDTSRPHRAPWAWWTQESGTWGGRPRSIAGCH